MSAAKGFGSRLIQVGCPRVERGFPGVFLPLDVTPHGEWRCLVLCPGHRADVCKSPWIYISEAWLEAQTDGL